MMALYSCVAATATAWRNHASCCISHDLLHVLDGDDGIIGVVSHHIVQQKSQSQESILGAPFCKMVAAGMHNAERLLRMIGTGQVWTLLVVIQCRPK
jgi:hypothetical protein